MPAPNGLPPLPEGFTLDQGGDVPPLPQGFTLDAPEAPRTAGQDFMHNQGLGLRATVEGASSLVTVPSDALAGLLDVAFEKAGVPFRFGSSSQAVSQLLTQAGVPQPVTEGEKTVSAIGRAISAVPGMVATGGAMSGAASPVVAGVGETMAASPIMQTASAATGATGSEIARRSGYGPVGQAVGGLVGASVPALATAATGAVRGAFRGGEQGRQTVEKNLQTFADAGTTPTVGQATEGRVARATESALAKVPGSAGVISSTAEQQASDVAAELESKAQQLVGRSTSAEETGRQIEKSITGEGGFIESFKNKQKELYNALDNFIPEQTPIHIDKTEAALAKLNANIPGAENTSKFFQNAKIKAIEGALTSDVQADGTLPYIALKKLRTMVGDEIADSTIASDVPRSKWKALYGALSEDLSIAVEPNPQAKAAWTRANNYTRAGMNRIDALDSVINRNGGPEAIFKAATSGTKEGASTLRAVMQSTDETGQKMITATVLRRLGVAKAGVQGDLGDRFSTETFLTNWNGLSTEAKRSLFNRYGDDFRNNMDQIAKFAANLREGSQVFRNPSGTASGAATVTLAGTVAAGVMDIMMGRIAEGSALLGTAATAVGSSNLAAKLMTNPRFVKWLAQSTKVPAGMYTAQVNRLVQTARDTKDLDLAKAAIVLQGQEQQNAGANQPQRAANQQ